MSIRKYIGVAAALLLMGGGCAWINQDKRELPPPEIHGGALVDVSQSQRSYEPVDPQMILALKDGPA